jgi:hypothetical protein
MRRRLRTAIAPVAAPTSKPPVARGCRLPRGELRIVLALQILAAAAAGLSRVDVGIRDVRAATPPPATEPSTGRPIVGVKIYEYRGELTGLFAQFGELGFNTLFVSEALASNAEFRRLARQERMAVFLIQPVFYQPEELEKDPELFAITNTGTPARDDWVAFACPSRDDRRRRRAEQIAATVARLQPEGLSIDFIRFFAYWERIHPERTYASIPNTCFCPRCLERFSRDTGVSLPEAADGPRAAAEWIASHRLEAWTAWKTGIITSMVEDIVGRVKAARSATRINLHAVPWRRDDFGGAIRKVVAQDFGALSRLSDYLSPMCYSAMLRRDPSWIASVVQDLAAQSSCPILPSIQVKAYYPGDSALGAAEFEAALGASLEPPSAGVVFWSWDLIEKSPEARPIIKRYCAPRAK